MSLPHFQNRKSRQNPGRHATPLRQRNFTAELVVEISGYSANVASQGIGMVFCQDQVHSFNQVGAREQNMSRAFLEPLHIKVVAVTTLRPLALGLGYPVAPSIAMIGFGLAIQDVQYPSQIVQGIGLPLICREPSIDTVSITVEQVIHNDAFTKFEWLIGFVIP